MPKFPSVNSISNGISNSASNLIKDQLKKYAVPLALGGAGLATGGLALGGTVGYLKGKGDAYDNLNKQGKLSVNYNSKYSNFAIDPSLLMATDDIGFIARRSAELAAEVGGGVVIGREIYRRIPKGLKPPAFTRKVPVEVAQTLNKEKPFLGGYRKPLIAGTLGTGGLIASSALSNENKQGDLKMNYNSNQYCANFSYMCDFGFVPPKLAKIRKGIKSGKANIAKSGALVSPDKATRAKTSSRLDKLNTLQRDYA